jgi:hypothetical protein
MDLIEKWSNTFPTLMRMQSGTLIKCDTTKNVQRPRKPAYITKRR